MRMQSKLAAVALTAALALGGITPALAAEPGYGVGGDAAGKVISGGNVSITKVLKTNEGSHVKAKFTFKVEGVTVDTGNGGSSESTDGLIPTIGDITLEATGDGADKSQAQAVTLPTYTHAGVYAYLISENATKAEDITNTDGASGTMVDSTDKYLMRVYVENGNSGVAVKSVTFEKNPTTSAVGTKVSQGNVKFENTFTEKTTPDTPGQPSKNAVKVTKNVTGGSGDHNKDWNFTVKFTAPTNVPAGWSVGQITASGVGGIQNADGTVTFKLKHGQTVTFDNVVIGTKYSVEESEANKDGYTTTGVFAEAKAVADDAANGVTVTNNKESVTPTGIVLNNLPFVLMGGVAVAGVVLYGAAKRKLER
ncbi:DUF7601 domain-containing protein [Olsenella phocaeensis]|uniref:DUF7601 domain-containing protein n=1 Tax=Olsenella phocaeensis TaxID=1852385 RepID=UPI000930AF42|nr:DUF5979 domain-containing protein [Olsenella phocaeensis]